MQIKKYYLPDFMIKEFETININFDQRQTDQRIKYINFLTRKNFILNATNNIILNMNI